MNRAEFIAWIGDLEQRFPLAGWSIDDIPAWPIVRLNLYATNFGIVQGASAIGRSHFSQLRAVARGMVQWVVANLADRAATRRVVETPVDAIFLATSIGQHPRIGQKRINPMLAPYVTLAEDVGMRTLVWETNPYDEYNVPRWTPSAFIQPWMTMRRIASQLVRPTPPTPSWMPEFVAELERVGLRTRYTSARALGRDVWFVRRMANQFGSWLGVIQPALGFISEYSLGAMAFCLACHEHNVLSVELQHGVQGDLHPAYSRWFSHPPGGYSIRPRAFWCRDEETSHVINAWSVPSLGHRAAVTGGDPWPAWWAPDAGAHAAELHEHIATLCKADDTTCNVLVTLDSAGPAVPEVMLDTMRLAPKTWRFWVRMHPSDQAQRRQNVEAVLREFGPRVADTPFATTAPLYSLLPHMDAHMSAAWSTVIAEAELMGVGSVAFESEAARIFAAQISRRTLHMATTSETMLAALEVCRQTRLSESPRGLDPSLAAMRAFLRVARGGTFDTPEDAQLTETAHLV